MDQRSHLFDGISQALTKTGEKVWAISQGRWLDNLITDLKGQWPGVLVVYAREVHLWGQHYKFKLKQNDIRQCGLYSCSLCTQVIHISSDITSFVVQIVRIKRIMLKINTVSLQLGRQWVVLHYLT